MTQPPSNPKPSVPASQEVQDEIRRRIMSNLKEFISRYPVMAEFFRLQMHLRALQEEQERL